MSEKNTLPGSEKRSRLRLTGFSKYTVISLALALLILVLLLHYAPFYAPSYFFWTGLLLVLIGLISCIKPLRFLLIANRKIAIAVVLGGLGISVCSLFWPVPLIRVDRVQQRIDDFMPVYSFREYHETRVQASPQRVMQAARQVSLSDMKTARLLLRLRAMAGGENERPMDMKTPILEMFTQANSGFLTLNASDPNEYVGGMTGRPWSSNPPPPVTTPEEFLSFRDAETVKVAFNFYVKRVNDNETLLSTETRILCSDDRARRIFGGYWRVIYPGSAIIRKIWLDAIADLAERL